MAERLPVVPTWHDLGGAYPPRRGQGRHEAPDLAVERVGWVVGHAPNYRARASRTASLCVRGCRHPGVRFGRELGASPAPCCLRCPDSRPHRQSMASSVSRIKCGYVSGPWRCRVGEAGSSAQMTRPPCTGRSRPAPPTPSAGGTGNIRVRVEDFSLIRDALEVMRSRTGRSSGLVCRGNGPRTRGGRARSLA